jgi:hypothetical protein
VVVMFLSVVSVKWWLAGRFLDQIYLVKFPQTNQSLELS